MPTARSIVFFDAVGTLIHPHPDVATAYQQVAERMGIPAEYHQIHARFRSAYSTVFGFPLEGCDEETERQRWVEIVKRVFQSSYCDSLFEALWDHFGDPDHWRVSSELSQLVDALQNQSIAVGIASNFDQRLLPVIKKHFPTLDPEFVFYSTRVGYAKPDVRFYKAIEKTLKGRGFAKWIMIGDDWRRDNLAARTAGWLPISIEEAGCVWKVVGRN